MDLTCLSSVREHRAAFDAGTRKFMLNPIVVQSRIIICVDRQTVIDQ